MFGVKTVRLLVSNYRIGHGAFALQLINFVALGIDMFLFVGAT